MATASSSSRRQPTRSARTSTNRPSNYYAKPFSYRSGVSSIVDNEPAIPTAPGFFPAITHFTDGVAALPKEVQRHFTMLKETEGKAYAPDQAIAELVTAIARLPPAPRPQTQERPMPFMQLPMANSVNGGSAHGSVIDGVAPAGLNSDIDMPDASQSQQQPTADEHANRRHDLYGRLHYQVNEMTKILEEKNMVLQTANETLGRQLIRLESSFPHIDNELSEDARLGSNTHWALPHMKELRRTNGTTTERRRDVTNVNNLAAAAAAVHETEIAATRSEARREAMLAKRSRAPPGYDFDDRGSVSGRKSSTTSTKVRKTADAAPATVNGSSGKRRRVDKPAAAAASSAAAASVSSERAMSAALHGRLAQPARSRDNSTAELARKKNKPAPPQASQRKKSVSSSICSFPHSLTRYVRPAANSDSLASSPTRGTFSTTGARTQSPARATGSRARQGSVASLVQEATRKRPVSAASTAGRKQEDADSALVAGPLSDRDSHIITNDDARHDLSSNTATEADIKREAVANDRGVSPAAHSRPGSKAAGAPSSTQPSSNPPKPHNIFADVAPLMARSRSGRGINPAGSPAGAASPLVGATQAPTGIISGAASPLAGHASGAASPVKRSHKRGGGSTATARDAATALASTHGSSGATSGTAVATPASSEDEGTNTTAGRSTSRRGRVSKSAGGNGHGNNAGAGPDERDIDSPMPGGGGASGNMPSLAAPGSVRSPPAGPLSKANRGGARPATVQEMLTAAATLPPGAIHPRDNPRGEMPGGDPATDDAGEEDEDEEAEPLYCFCQQPSEGEMIACDNEACPTEWFHLECVALARAPKNSWYCSEGCKRQAARGRR